MLLAPITIQPSDIPLETEVTVILPIPTTVYKVVPADT